MILGILLIVVGAGWAAVETMSLAFMPTQRTFPFANYWPTGLLVALGVGAICADLYWGR